MSVIKGENAILYWKVDGFFKPIACMESCNVTTNTELAETSTIQTGIYRTYRGNRNTWTVSAQGVCSFDTNHPHVKLRLLQQSMTPVFISFTATDDNGISETFSGNVLITTLPTDATATDFYRYSIEATGTGEYQITDIPIDPNECCQDDWIYYTGNGSEGYNVTHARLKGVTVSGRLYRDGIEYRPSGVDHNGTGTPAGKQFKHDKTLGKLTFDSSLPAIALGEQIDIPINLCSGGSLTCDIVIENVMAEPGLDTKFRITFQPVVDGETTVPDNVTVRYSTDGGETWQTPGTISYFPDEDYGLLIIEDALPTDEAYLFELTPVCNDQSGTAGTGVYYPCINATFETVPDMPNAILGEDYVYAVALDGSAPFELVINDKPDWMTIELLGATVQFTGTPDAEATESVDIEITNCSSGSLPFTDTFDVVAVLTPSILIGSALCRSTGSCNDNAVCGVNYAVNVNNAPVGSYIDVSGISGPASITISDSDPATGKVNYVEPNGIGSTNFTLELKDSGGTVIASQFTTLSHQSFWQFLGTC